MIKSIKNTAILILVFCAMLFAIYILYSQNKRLANDIARVSENFNQIQNDNYTLNLKIGEFKTFIRQSNDSVVMRTDSIMKANRIKPSYVTEVNNYHYSYVDTTSGGGIKIDSLRPISYGNECWGFDGEIKSDSLIISKKWSNTDIDLIKYVRPKRFLGIRVGWRDESYALSSTCGNATLNQIKVKRAK